MVSLPFGKLTLEENNEKNVSVADLETRFPEGVEYRAMLTDLTFLLSMLFRT